LSNIHVVINTHGYSLSRAERYTSPDSEPAAGEEYGAGAGSAGHGFFVV
jgi:hypothetical protein